MEKQRKDRQISSISTAQNALSQLQKDSSTLNVPLIDDQNIQMRQESEAKKNVGNNEGMIQQTQQIPNKADLKQFNIAHGGQKQSVEKKVGSGFQKQNIQEEKNQQHLSFIQVLLKHFEEYKSCRPFSRDNYQEKIKQVKALIQKKKINKQQLDSTKSILDSKYQVDSQQKLKDMFEDKFTMIDSFLQAFSDVNTQTDEGYEEIKEVSLEIFDLIILVSLSQTISPKQIFTFQECLTIVERAKIDYKIKLDEQFQVVLKKAIENQTKLRVAFQKTKKLDKVSQADNKIKSIKQILEIFKVYSKLRLEMEEIQRSKPKKVKITIKVLQNPQKKIIQCSMNDTAQDIIKMLAIQSAINLKVCLYSRQNQKYIQFQKSDKIKDLLEQHANFTGLIKKNLQVELEGKVHYFAQFTPLDAIVSKIGNKSKNYGFWDKDLKHQTQRQLRVNLSMKQISKNISLVFDDIIVKDISLPSETPIKELIKYIDLFELFSNDENENRRELILNKDTQLLFRSININGNITNLELLQQSTIGSITKGKIQFIYLTFKSFLNIYFMSRKNTTQIKLVAYGDIKIEQLKMKLMEKTKLQHQKQNWKIKDQKNQELRNQDTLFSKKLYESHLRVEVREIQNLEYYGFSKNSNIASKLFFDYSIEDDEKFIRELSISIFPAEQYESSFRVSCLRMIFTAIKKHCSIQTAIKYIKQLNKKVKLDSSIKNIQKDKLWLSQLMSQITRFNEGYLLHHLLLCSQQQLRIAIMNGYKGQSSIFYKTVDEKCEKISYEENHFWLSSKSFYIISIQIVDDLSKQSIKGKSNALNMIFDTNFQIAAKRHPICSNSISIAYNIYRNEDLPVNIIDVSSNSCSESEKIQLCKASNMILIHYLKESKQKVDRWITENCPNKLCILLQRDNNSTISENKLFNEQLQKNQINKSRKKYSLPQLTQQLIHYFQNQIPEIVNQIHLFIQKSVLKPQASNNLWSFPEYLAQQSPQKKKIVEILKYIQRNFEKIINLQLISKQIQEITQEDLEKQLLTHQVRMILDFVDSEKYSKLFFKMLRDYIRGLRSQRLKSFLNLQKLLKIFEIKEQVMKSQISVQIKSILNDLSLIPIQRKTKQFQEILDEISKVNISQKQFSKLQKKIQRLNMIFQSQIKQREFSIQTFWRGLTILFHSSIQVPQKIISYKQKAQNLFNSDFASGNFFEVINGETMQMPINLIKSLQSIILNKKVIVVGVFGPQSSGKSTLLNYLFGCDFASSDGRCTSGVYGTYYEISGGTLAYDGILILDTEGLFSNYERKNPKACNFDNKLVLFLISVCDLVILNTRGDVDVRCEEILEVSFDSQLMAHKNGAIYPHFYIVLNQNANIMGQNQFQQVIRLANKIKAAQPQMENYLNSNQAETLPLAFNINDKKNIFEVLKRIQLKSKTPTDEFYTKTKQLSIKQINTFQKRTPRPLVQVFDLINANWRAIISNPNYTMFKSKFLKEQDVKMNIQTAQRAKEKSQIIAQWLKETPIGLISLQNYAIKMGIQFERLSAIAKTQFQTENPQGSNSDINQIVNKYENWLLNSLNNNFQSFKIKIDQKIKQAQLIQFQKRGLFSINEQARELKRLMRDNVDISTMKQQRFRKAWQSHVEIVGKNNDSLNVSRRKFKEIKEGFQIYLKQIGKKIDLNYDQSLIRIQMDNIQDYSKFLEHIIQSQNNSNFLAYFKTLNVDPIIIVQQKSNSSIKGNYLRMYQFFEPKKQLISYYLKQSPLNMINQTQIKSIFLSEMRKCKTINDYFNLLVPDLAYFNVKIAKRQRFQDEVMQFILLLLLKEQKSIVSFNLTHQMLDIDYSTNPITGDGWFSKNTRGLLKKCQQQSFHKENKAKKIYIQPQQCNLNILWSPETMQAIYQQFKTYKRVDAFFTIKKAIFNSLLNYFKSIKNEILKEISQIYDYLRQLIAQAFSKIGIRIYKDPPLNFAFSQRRLYIDSGLVAEGTAPVFQNYGLLIQNINNLPMYCNICKIKGSLIENRKQNSCLIGQAYTIKMGIKEKYKNSKDGNNDIIKILSNYLNKDYACVAANIKTSQFKNKIFSIINKFAFVNKIQDFLQKQFSIHSSLDSNLRKIVNIIDCQINDFNEDLKQISHCLSQNFIVQIYSLSACLLSKQYQLLQVEKAKETLKKLDKQRQKQRNTFMDSLDGNQNESQASAKYFVEQYKKYLSQIIIHKKMAFLDKRRDEFLANNNRRLFQEKVEDELLLTEDQQIAYQYLTKQKDHLIKKYNQLIENEINTKLSSEIDFELDFVLQQLRTFIQDQYNYLLSTSNQNAEEAEKNWESINVFSQKEGKQKDNIQLARVFTTLLRNTSFPRITIDNKYKDNFFNLNNNIRFENKSFFKNKANLDFIQEFQYQQSQFQIHNYFLFLSEMLKCLKSLQNQLKPSLKFRKDEKSKHKSNINLEFCNSKCPFCGRFCEIDLKDHSGKKHKCFSGHQLRALQSITIQIKDGKAVTNYGSVHRCDQMKDSLRIVFNNVEKSWGDHKKQVTEWQFLNERGNSSEGLFRSLWNLAGPRICRQKQQQTNSQFQFIKVDDFMIKHESIENQSNHFIFAIDGSASMVINNNWNNQLSEIKNYLVSIRGNSKNRVSIIVWTCQYIASYIGSPVKDIDIDKIPFPKGGTDPCEAFKGALFAMSKRHLNENIYFIYTSDGDGTYPDAQIKLMADKKKAVQMNGFKFVSMAVKIGSGGGSLFDKIAAALGSKSVFVSSAADIGDKIKQIMRT